MENPCSFFIHNPTPVLSVSTNVSKNKTSSPIFSQCTRSDFLLLHGRKGVADVAVVLSGQVEPVVVAGPEGRVALGALPLAGLVARAEAVVAEAVEALREHGVLALDLYGKRYE